jgi:threonine/homoserine/homoserine lactone efflux protein
MPLESYAAFVGASVLLIAMPGPMVALIVANSLRYGARSGLKTVAGAAAGLSAHLALVGAGLMALLATLGQALTWLKWIAAAYLLYLGLRAILRGVRPGPGRAEDRRRPSARRMFSEAFLVQIANPKLLIFYAAFFPLFLAPDAPIRPQLLLMSGTLLAIEATLDSLWALSAARARRLAANAGRWPSRIAGGVLIAAASLAVVRR